MSSAKPRAKPATAKSARRSKPPIQAVEAPPESPTSVEARRLVAEMNRGLAEGRLDVLSPQALQELMSAACRTYSAHVEAGQQFLPVSERCGVNSTDVMVTASGMLKAANLAVFELGMWQSWTGR